MTPVRIAFCIGLLEQPDRCTQTNHGTPEQVLAGVGNQTGNRFTGVQFRSLRDALASSVHRRLLQRTLSFTSYTVSLLARHKSL